MTTSRSCPDCRLSLAAAASGSVLAHRCGRCRGIWLDPASFRRLCDDEARPPGEEAAIVRSAGGSPRSAPRPDDRVRYRACPECGDVMNRTNFGRVSGVVIDVCRPHGAWFDRGELAAIRRFLREGGLRRWERHRESDTELRASLEVSPPRKVPADDVYEVLLGGDSSWDVPSRIPRLLVAAFFAAVGTGLLWWALRAGSYVRPRGEAGVALGLAALWFAWRALRQWLERGR
jgi:Zn-finger nucleic acid-binding protein